MVKTTAPIQALLTMIFLLTINSYNSKVYGFVATALFRNSVYLYSASSGNIELSDYHSFFSEFSTEQLHQLQQLRIGLTEWNEKVNLVSRKDIDRLVPNHIIPSLSIYKLRESWGGETVIDVGCGGGFPGLPMAIACPNTRFTLLDSNGKKMKVVEDLVNQLQLKNVKVVNDRAENHKEKYQILMGRAVSAIPNFLGYSSHLLDTDVDTDTATSSSAYNSGLLYLKGGDFTEELAEAQVTAHSLHQVRDLVPIASEKYILHIPRDQIINFRNRLAAEENNSKKKSNKETNYKTKKR